MGSNWSLLLNGDPIKGYYDPKGIVTVEGLKAGDVLELVFPIETVEKKEFFAGKEYTEVWRGGDLVDLLPRGDHIRLYQRDLSKPRYYPTPDEVEFTGAADRGPTQQQKVK